MDVVSYRIPSDMLVRPKTGAEMLLGTEKTVNRLHRLVGLLHSKDGSTEIIHCRRHQQRPRCDQPVCMGSPFQKSAFDAYISAGADFQPRLQ
jgi:hypothetical protein